MGLIRPDRIFLGVLSTCLAIYALLYADWQYPGVLATLTLLLFTTEVFQIRVGKARLPCSFPILYAMSIVTGLEATLLILKCTLFTVQTVTRQPMQALLFSCLLRALALLGGGWAARSLSWLGLSGSELPDLLLHLIVFTLVYTLIASGLFLWRTALYSNQYHQMRSSLVKAAAWHLVLGFSYGGMMHWIGAQSEHPYADPQMIGTLFFFLPLVGIAIVMYLITNLSHTKSKLETLFEISQSTSNSHDLPTVLGHLIGEATRLVQGSCGLLYLVQEGGSLQLATTSSRTASIRFPKGAGLVGLSALTGETLLIPDVTTDPRFHPGETHAYVRALLLVPFRIDGKVAGVMSLGKKELDTFQSDDVKLMSIFATHASAAMKKILMIEEREKRLLLEERNRLAREIHDGLAQDLAGIIFQVDLLKRTADPEMAAELNNLQHLLRKSVATVRHSIYELRPAPYAQLGLVPSMQQQLNEVESKGICTHFTVHLPPETLPAPIAKAVFQIFTETVQNVVKHAAATDLFITLNGDEEALTLSVKDNGRGFHFGKAIVQAAARHSFGIENLHNTADEIGGTLDYLTSPGTGTEVILRIPLKEEEEDDDTRVAL